MALRWMYDASTPPETPPHWHVVGGYIGGNTPHVWTEAEWNAQPAPYRLPIFTASNRSDDAAMANIDGGIIREQLTALGVREGMLVCVDTETTVYTYYLEHLNMAVRPWRLMNYGSLSFVIRNPVTDGGRWAALWTGDIFKDIPLIGQHHIVAAQWASDVMLHKPYDASVIDGSLPLWPAHL